MPTRASSLQLDGQLVLADRVVAGAVTIQGQRITAVRLAPRRRVPRRYIAPGLIDLHIWGDPAVIGRTEVRGGTTSFLCAIAPSPLAVYRERLGMCRAQTQQQRRTGSDGAWLLGAHLEGPYLNRRMAGALPPRWMRAARTKDARQLLRAGRGALRMMTVAPEVPGALTTIRRLRDARVVVSLGHSAADAVTAQRAVAAGAAVVTHLYNRMPPLDHREPNLTTVALYDHRLAACLIADGAHVHPAMMRLAYRLKGADRLILTTDAIRHGRASRHRHAARLSGSRITMMQSIGNMVRLAGATIPEAVRMASTNPARLLGLRRTGALAVGCAADLVVFDERFRVRQTIVGGRIVYQRK